MRRAILVEKLRNLGWIETTEPSGVNHTIWIRRGRRLAIPTYELIYDATAERLVEQAER